MRAVLKVISAAMLICATPLGAQEIKPFPQFTSKRVKAPSRGSKPVIDVQIDPVEQARVLRDAPKPTPKTDSAQVEPTAPQVPKSKFDWFWDRVSTDLAQAGAGRLDGALQVLIGAGAKAPAPRLQDLQNIVAERGVDILVATVNTKVSPALALAVIAVESSGKTDAVSSAGAQGLMQLMPATAARFGVEDSMSPVQNISGGVKYLDWLMAEFEGDPILALAGYNAGEGAVRKHAGVPPFAETRNYVPKVLAAFHVAKGLCKTPPLLASDGCVFVSMK